MAVEDHVARRVLEHGFLATQLPPLFTSTSMSAAVDVLDRSLDLRSDGKPRCWTEPVRFSAARLTGLRRRLAVPNPYSYLRIVDEIANQWRALSSHWDQSDMSVSRPRLSTPDKGIDDGRSFRLRDERRLNAATVSRFRLRTDIAQCYGSTYTHSLSWALGGKSAAKANLHDKAFPGAGLDLVLREAQDGQTIGLPVGPQSSLAAAEVILCAVDKRLQDRNLVYTDAFRSIDDYEVFASTRSDAETFLQVLETELAHFELGLNASKTWIDEAPILIEDRWKSQLAAFAPPDRRVGRGHVRAFINEVFALAREHPHDPVVSYALKMADSLKTSSDGEQLLIHAALATLRFSAPSIRYALWSIMNRLARLDLDRALLWSCLNRLVLEAASVEHSYEVTWGIWALLVSDGRLELEPSEAVAAMNDPFSLIAYMRLYELGRVSGPPAQRLAEIAKEPLTETSDAWILAHEANIRGWGNPGTLRLSPFFNSLKEFNITFLDDEVRPLELEGDDGFFDPSDFNVPRSLELETYE